MKVKAILLIGMIIGCSYTTFAQSIIKQKKKIIIIDPGHGGKDSGAITIEGIQEKEIVLDIARSMFVWNQTLLESKYDMYLTRTKDTLISLSNRTKLVRYLKPDVFISLHCNQIHDSNIQGVEVYTYDETELSQLYAKAILNELNRHLGFKIREPKQANFHVLREVREHCPALLLELGYLSNTSESEYISKKENRKALALAILMSI